MMIFRTDASNRGFMMHLIDHIYFADLHPPAMKSLSYLKCENYDTGKFGTKREP